MRQNVRDNNGSRYSSIRWISFMFVLEIKWQVGKITYTELNEM